MHANSHYNKISTNEKSTFDGKGVVGLQPNMILEEHCEVYATATDDHRDHAVVNIWLQGRLVKECFGEGVTIARGGINACWNFHLSWYSGSRV
jgi:hypothetical protein